MKRFLLFVGDTYYAAGGWNDYVDSYDSQIEAAAAAFRVKGDWFQVVDTQPIAGQPTIILSAGE